MKTWTVQTAPGRAPMLVAEGFSWGALVFGPCWLAAQRAWSMAAVALAVYLAIGLLTPTWTLLIPAVVLGLFGRDCVRLSLEFGGFVVVHIVAASSFDAALARLLARRPDLVPDMVMQELRQ